MAMGMKDTVTSDVAGAVERYVEQRYGDKAVVLYTVGSPPGVALNARRAIPGTTPADPRALIAATGTVLGEEVLAASQRVKLSGSVSIEGMLREIECPGKITTPLNTPTSCSDAPGATLPKCVFTTKDGPPVKLRMGVIRIGDMAIVHSDANISAVVWDEVQRQAPAGTILVALGYGPVHYVMEDAAYPSNSYPVTASMVKPGCAAPGFVSTSLGMLRRR